MCWSQLLPDLVVKIAGILTNVPDYIRFRAVCPTWRTFSSPPPRFSPWLLLSVSPTHFHFLNPSENWKLYLLPNPASSSPRPHPYTTNASAHGFLLLQNKVNIITFVNPLCPLSKPFTSVSHPDGIMIDVAKFVQSSQVSICGSVFSATYFWRPGEDSWKAYIDAYFNDFTVYRGRLFLTRYGSQETDVVDASTFTRISQIQPPDHGIENSRAYLVEEPLSGDMLLVVWDFVTTRLCVFRLEDFSQQWVMIRSIGDVAIFLDIHNAVCFPTDKYNEVFNGNCIYVVTYWNGYKVRVHNLVEQTTEVLRDVSMVSKPVWMVPSLS